MVMDGWVFGGLCGDCGGPMYQFCPGCGVDLFRVGHAVVTFPWGPLTVCRRCGDGLKRGQLPAIRHGAHSHGASVEGAVGSNRRH